MTLSTKKKVDYMLLTGWRKVAVFDRTKNRHGLPTFEAMERQLRKALKQ